MDKRMTLRDLHVAADAALVAYEHAKAARKAAQTPLELRPAILTMNKADRALARACEARNEPTKELCDAMWAYLDNPLVANWDRLMTVVGALGATGGEE